MLDNHPWRGPCVDENERVIREFLPYEKSWGAGFPVENVRSPSKFVILCSCVCCSCETFRFDLKGLRVTNS